MNGVTERGGCSHPVREKKAESGTGMPKVGLRSVPYFLVNIILLMGLEFGENRGITM
jgi:hypothetical protein